MVLVKLELGRYLVSIMIIFFFLKKFWVLFGGREEKRGGE